MSSVRRAERDRAVTDIPGLRLHNSRLSGRPFESAAEAVSHLGAVQAQDFAAAKWALGLRVKGATDASLERAFDRGAFLRTHVLRPTWHLVAPEDIRWMLELTAPRVRATVARSNRRLELDAALLAKSNAAIVGALQDRGCLTRKELKEVLERAGIRTNVQRLAHVVMWAELDGLICSGPKRGKQFTYALLEDRAPRARRRPPRRAAADLARRYFTGHGPAQLTDFTWWSGLQAQDAREALDRVRPGLRQTLVDGRIYWSGADRLGKAPSAPEALLLSLYDEYAIAYRDRRDISDARDVERMISRGNASTSIIVLRGRVAGTWKRVRGRDSIVIRLDPVRRLSARERQALEAQVDRYGQFLGVPATLG